MYFEQLFAIRCGENGRFLKKTTPDRAHNGDFLRKSGRENPLCVFCVNWQLCGYLDKTANPQCRLLIIYKSLLSLVSYHAFFEILTSETELLLTGVLLEPELLDRPECSVGGG